MKFSIFNLQFKENDKSTMTPMQSTAVLNEKASLPSTFTPNFIWAKGIPKFNKVCMMISIIFVFVLDPLIGFKIPNFRNIMLEIFVVFIVFFFLENFVFSKKFANTTSILDRRITWIVVFRNFIFLLNFFPVIQLIGLMFIFSLIVPLFYVVVYASLIVKRYSVKKTNVNRFLP